MAREFTSDWVSQHIFTWHQLLGPIASKPGLCAIEIGSHEGRSACWWLENVLTDGSSMLTCVDPWHDSAVERRFDLNIADTGKLQQVQKWKFESRKAFHLMPDSSLDFAYIDGWHEARDVLFDGLAVLPLLKPGGMLIFDDYEWNIAEMVTLPPKPGIDAFLTLCASEIVEIHRGWQIVVRKV